MDKKSLYDLNIFEKMGTPLINAVVRSSYAEGGGINAGDVTKIAELLNTTVKLSQNLSASFKPQDEQDVDAIRTAIACLVSPIIGEHYTRTGNEFSDDDLQKFQQILEKVLSFSDNLAEAKESANKRMSLVNPDALGISNVVLYDDEQIALQVIEAFLPVVEELSAFSFGRDSRELLSEIIDKLRSQSKIAAKALYGKIADDGTRQLAELGLIRSLTQIYAMSHAAEKKRIMDLSEEERDELVNDKGEIPLDSLWAAFNERYSLIITLAKSINAEKTSASAGASSGETAKKPAAEKPAPAPETTTPNATPEAQPSAASQAQAQAQKAPEQPQQAETPSAAPQEEAPKAEEKPSKEAVAENSSDNSSDASSENPPENPMSFFSKKKSG